jgi:hypothetical protein
LPQMVLSSTTTLDMGEALGFGPRSTLSNPVPVAILSTK